MTQAHDPRHGQRSARSLAHAQLADQGGWSLTGQLAMSMIPEHAYVFRNTHIRNAHSNSPSSLLNDASPKYRERSWALSLIICYAWRIDAIVKLFSSARGYLTGIGNRFQI